MARSKKVFSFKDLIYIALFTVAICLVAPMFFEWQAAIPVTAATGIICLTAAVIGFKRSLISVILYLLLGALGLPVFANWAGGYMQFAGRTGGYLIGFLALTAITGLIVDRNPKNAYLYFVGMIAGVAGCLFIGSMWLVVFGNFTFVEAIKSGFTPFITFECVKIFLAGMVAYPLRAIVLKKVL